MVKEKESDVADISFELQDKNGDRILRFHVCRNLKNCSHCGNQMSDSNEVLMKTFHFSMEKKFILKVEHCRHVPDSLEPVTNMLIQSKSPIPLVNFKTQ